MNDDEQQGARRETRVARCASREGARREARTAGGVPRGACREKAHVATCVQTP